MSEHQKLPIEIVARILFLSKKKPHIVLKEKNEFGEIIFEFNAGKLLHLENGTLDIFLGEEGLKIKGNLVGMGGFYYHPKIFWGINVKKVEESWNWFLKALEIDVWRFQSAIESSAILDFLFSGHEEGLILYFFSLVIDLYELNLENIDITSKIDEVKNM